MQNDIPQKAAFIDRDGTLIEEVNFLSNVDDLRVFPFTYDAVKSLKDAGFLIIVVTNQSGIARGLLDADDYDRVRARTNELVAADGGRIDATYMCPHYPDITGPCDCRKPGLLLYKQAIAEHGLDPHRSLFVGDRWRDVAPAAALGGRGILLDVESTPSEDRERAQRESIETAQSLGEAVQRFLAALPAPDLRQ